MRERGFTPNPQGEGEYTNKAARVVEEAVKPVVEDQPVNPQGEGEYTNKAARVVEEAVKPVVEDQPVEETEEE